MKIDLGCHVDGYIAVAAHTLMVPPARPRDVFEIITGPCARVMLATYAAAEISSRLIKSGNNNRQVRGQGSGGIHDPIQ